MKKGKVYLIGAGPGDPELITVKGLECIKTAQVLIYDYLASPVLLKYASDKAECIYVGKKGGNHTLSQDGINALIADKAFDSNTLIADLNERGAKIVISQHPRRAKPLPLASRASPKTATRPGRLRIST